jgi:hypothetical protein
MQEEARNLGSGQIQWRNIDPVAAEALLYALKKWEGTPYMAGQRALKIGLDCVQSIPAVMDMVFKKEKPTPVPRLSPDSGAHSNVPGLQIARILMESYDAYPVDDGFIEPGDVVVIRNERSAAHDRMGHCMIAGVRPMTAWHAQMGGGFTVCSLYGEEIIKVYRTRSKHLWGRKEERQP